MNRKLLSILLSALVLLTLISGCNVQLNLDTDNPQVNVEIPDALGGGSLNVQVDKDGPKVSVEEKAPQIQPEFYPDLDSIPPYDSAPYVAVNGNQPFFTSEDITDQSFEFYSDLDDLGRCGLTMASIGQDLMPTEKRGSIQEVRPTGWHSVKYDWVEGKSLYNRCHLIGFQLAGENANERNLITGTRYLNIEGMLPFENMVADYVKETGNHVMYRVTPIFTGDNLVADGVLMEGLSVEDQGEGITFCVFAYNVQPGVTIDYATGESRAAKDNGSASQEETDFILNTGSHKFHLPGCSGAEKISEKNRQTYHGTRDSLIKKGYQPCGSCNP